MSARPRLVACGVIAGLVAASLGAPRVAPAQLRGAVDIGGASVRYGDSVRVTATTVAPTVRLDGGPLTVVASGGVSTVGAGAWSSQGGLAASLLSRPFGVGRVEFVGAGGGTMHKDGTQTGQYLGRARLHATGRTRGLWIGLGAGKAWDGSLWRRSVEGDLGAWGQGNAFTVLGTVRPAAIGDSIRFTDFAALLRRDGSRWELTASAGLRAGVVARRGSPNGWGSASVAMWVTPQLAMVADGGTYPADLSQGFPGGTYLSLALRIASHRRWWTREQPHVVANSARRPAGGTANARVEIVARGGGKYTLRVRAPHARRVEIMGDFTNWTSAELVEASGGWWSTVISITPGARQMNVRLDGGPWVVPGGSVVETDEFGAPVGVVIVR